MCKVFRLCYNYSYLLVGELGNLYDAHYLFCEGLNYITLFGVILICTLLDNRLLHKPGIVWFYTSSSKNITAVHTYWKSSCTNTEILHYHHSVVKVANITAVYIYSTNISYV